MSTNQSKTNKGNQKGGAEDQRRKENDKGDAKPSEQSLNDKKHLQQGQRQPRVELGTSKVPAGDATPGALQFCGELDPLRLAAR